MLTKEELKTIVSKLPRDDAHGEIIKDAAAVYELLEDMFDKDARDIKDDKITITVGERVASIPMYTAAVVNALDTMLEEVVRESLPNVAYMSIYDINETVRCDAERMVVDNVFRNHEVMSDEEFQRVYRVAYNNHQSRLREAVDSEDKPAVDFYLKYDNRYDYAHDQIHGGDLYHDFLAADDINKFPQPNKYPQSILDIEPVERCFYIEFIDDFFHRIGVLSTDQDYTESMAIEWFADSHSL